MGRGVKKRIDVREVRGLFSYDPETGHVYRTPNRIGRPPLNPCGSLNTKGHLQTWMNGGFVLVHRLAWILHHGYDPELQIDHINRVKTDNRACNLRLATPSQQSANRGVKSDSISGIKGLYYKNNRWYVSVNGKSLGSYPSKVDEIVKYNEEALKVHGEFAVLTEITDEA